MSEFIAPSLLPQRADPNPSEIRDHQDDTRVPENARTSSEHTPLHPDSTRMVFFGDHSLHFTHQRGPIQSRIFDKKIGVSIRPQALNLAATILQRETERLIENPEGDFDDHFAYNLGDVMDISNLSEWALYLNASDENTELSEILDKENTKNIDQIDDWAKIYIQSLNQVLQDSAPMAEGNHDGAYAGNGLNHMVDPTDLKIKILRLKRHFTKLENRIERIQKRMLSQHDSERLQSLGTKLEFLKEQKKITQEKITSHEKLLDRYYKGKKELDEQQHALIPGWLINIFLNAAFAIPRGRTLFDPEGYAAKNSGGTDRIVDKKKFMHLYLSNRYPELNLNEETLAPLAVSLELFEEENGYYRTDRSHFSSLHTTSPSGITQNFKNFWKEVRPGEYICLLSYSDRQHASANKKYIMLQAIDQGFDAGGKRIFHFILDGMDSTEENVPIAFFGVMSEWQRRLCQFFIDYQRLQYSESGCLFMHTSHFPLRDISKRHWKEFGWLDYFQQKDVAPFIFSGHRHKRTLIDATKKNLVGLQFPFGTPSIKKKEAYSLGAPSLTDNLEFMSVETWYDPHEDDLNLKVRYHEIVPKDDNEIKKRFAPDVIDAANKLSEYYRQNRYREASQLRDDFFSSVYNVFFTNQEAVVAFDSIPVSIYQYKETLVYVKYYLKFLIDDLGEDHDFVKLVKKTYFALIQHYKLWLHGNPDADNEWDQRGYLAVKKETESLSKKEAIKYLVHFNDIFATPYYELIRHLITETPYHSEGHKAYDFWLLLARKAADEEKKLPDKRSKRLSKKTIPNEVLLEFTM